MCLTTINCTLFSFPRCVACCISIMSRFRQLDCLLGLRIYYLQTEPSIYWNKQQIHLSLKEELRRTWNWSCNSTSASYNSTTLCIFCLYMNAPIIICWCNDGVVTGAICAFVRFYSCVFCYIFRIFTEVMFWMERCEGCIYYKYFLHRCIQPLSRQSAVFCPRLHLMGSAWVVTAPCNTFSTSTGVWILRVNIKKKFSKLLLHWQKCESSKQKLMHISQM